MLQKGRREEGKEGKKEGSRGVEGFKEKAREGSASARVESGLKEKKITRIDIRKKVEDKQNNARWREGR